MFSPFKLKSYKGGNAVYHQIKEYVFTLIVLTIEMIAN